MIDLDQLEARRRAESAERMRIVRQARAIFMGFGIVIILAALALVAFVWLEGCGSYSDCGDGGACGCSSNEDCGKSEICSGGQCWAFESQPLRGEKRDGN